MSTRGRSDSVISLAELAPGRHATVMGTVPQANPAVAHRLGQLGFRAQVRVDVIRRAPLGDPTVYRVLDTDVCLRRRQAALIDVALEAGE